MIQRINLIPEELAPKKIRVSLPFKYIIVGALALGYIIPLHLSVTSDTKKVDSERRSLESRKLELVTNNMKYDTLQNEIENMNGIIAGLEVKAGAFKGIVDKKILWSDILKEVSYLVPDSLWLSEIVSGSATIDVPAQEGGGDSAELVEITVKEVKLRGSSYSNKLIGEFTASLEGSYFLEDIKLSYVTKRVINDTFIIYDFEIVSSLKKNL